MSGVKDGGGEVWRRGDKDDTNKEHRHYGDDETFNGVGRLSLSRPTPLPLTKKRNITHTAHARAGSSRRPRWAVPSTSAAPPALSQLRAP